MARSAIYLFKICSQAKKVCPPLKYTIGRHCSSHFSYLHVFLRKIKKINFFSLKMQKYLIFKFSHEPNGKCQFKELELKEIDWWKENNIFLHLEKRLTLAAVTKLSLSQGCQFPKNKKSQLKAKFSKKENFPKYIKYILKYHKMLYVLLKFCQNRSKKGLVVTLALVRLFHENRKYKYI